MSAAPTVKLSHSFSALKMFSNCPKQYYHERIVRDAKQVSGEATIWGERVHEALEHYLKGTADLPEGMTQWGVLCDAFAKLPGELLAEQEMTLNVKLEPTGWWDSDAWLRSKIDILVINGPDAVVADWKTGKRRPDSDQLELFALQVFKHHPDVQRVRTTFVWLKDMKMDTKQYDRTDEVALWINLLGKIRRVEDALKNDNWPARPSGLCPWCPVYDRCEYAR